MIAGVSLRMISPNRRVTLLRPQLIPIIEVRRPLGLQTEFLVEFKSKPKYVAKDVR
jgi:hypothetical protein